MPPFGRHDVKDKDHWLASPNRRSLPPLGVTNIRTFVDPQNPTQVAVLMDVADLDVRMAAMQFQPMAEAMAYDGVLGETLVFLAEAAFPFSEARGSAPPADRTQPPRLVSR